MPPSVIRQFRDWFWRPPRAHGEVIRDRSVSYLELLYDLVYVAVIAQVAGALAKNVSVETVIQFAVIFTLVWIAWINGTLYLELHGREDGRTRAFVFVQMGILALVAVFAGTAAADGGTGFAIAYFVFLIVQTLGWNSVRRLDTPEVARVTIQYIGAMLAMAVLILISAFLAPGPRLVTWALASAAWLVYMVILGTRSRSFRLNVIPTHSMVERFDLFVIIVLGELVFDVVVGLSNTKHDLLTIATGVLSAKRAHELRIEWVERGAGEELRLGPQRPEVLDDGGLALAVAEHVDAPAPVVEVQPEVIEDAVHEADPERPPPPAAFLLGPVIGEQDTAERTH